MNLRLVCKQLAIVAMLIGGTMVFSLPWAWPVLGHRTDEKYAKLQEFETSGFIGLAVSIAISFAVGGLMWAYGKSARGHFYRKEAMAVVGLSWVLATLLGAIPFLLSGTYRSSSVRIFDNKLGQVYGHGYDGTEDLSPLQLRTIEKLSEAGARGLSPSWGRCAP